MKYSVLELIGGKEEGLKKWIQGGGTDQWVKLKGRQSGAIPIGKITFISECCLKIEDQIAG